MKNRNNPWYSIPAADYEGHMNHPSVGQLAFLADRTEAAARRLRPTDVCVLGCASGNGFNRLGDGVKRIVGVDLNKEYLAIAKARHGGSTPELELICADLLDCDFSRRPFNLIIAALVFEYIPVGKALKKISNWLVPGGELLVILQLPGKAAVSQTGFDSLKSLEPIMSLVDPKILTENAGSFGLTPQREMVHTLFSGKRFWECSFSFQRIA